MAAVKPWPAEINTTILQEGYSKTYQPNILVTGSDAGPVQRRRRFTAVPARHNIQLRLDNSIIIKNGKTEYQLFEDFVYNTLYGGVANTTFPLPWDYTSRTCFFAFSNGAQPYTPSKYWGNYIYVTFTLEEVLS